MNLRRTLTGVLLVLGFAAGACGDDPAPAEIRVTPGAVTFDALGDSVTLVATVLDQEGRVMPRRSVEFTTNGPGVVRVDRQGVVTSVGPGATTVLVISGRAAATIPASVVPEAATLRPLSATQLTGTAGDPLPGPVVVEALDRLGSPAQGVDLDVRVDAGGGAVGATSMVTDAEGRLSVVWTLGPEAGAPQELSIRAAGGGVVVLRFRAIAVAGPPASLTVISGEGQVGLPGAELPTPLRFRVRDRLGNPTPAQAVQLLVVSGGGQVEGTSAVTDSTGTASVRWRLGPEAGEQRIGAAAGTAYVEATATAVTSPAALRIVQDAPETGVVGEVVGPITVRLEDAAGDGIPGIPVRFRLPAGTGSLSGEIGEAADTAILVVTDGAGQASLASWTLGPEAGFQQLEASFPGLSPLTLSLTAAPGPPHAVVSASGSFQTGTIQEPLENPVVVRVDDRFGNAVPGMPVAFQAAPGSGSAVASAEVTDVRGRVSAAWTLGSLGGLQTLSATVVGVDPLEIHAAGLLPAPEAFHVEVEFLSPVDPLTWASAQVAANRWRSIVVGDLPDVTADVGPDECGPGSPPVQGIVDDVRIFVTVQPMDGAGGTLGAAGPCWIRGASGLPFLGRMRLDSDDLVRMTNRGLLVDLITHEIGHVLGVGTLWKNLELVHDLSLVTPGADTYFSGPVAVAAFDAAGGATYTGAKVPVENARGGAGTQDVHWRESVLGQELMTGFLDEFQNPLSTVTVGSLQDMGYAVDLGGSDSFFLAPALIPGRPREQTPLVDDVLWLPIRIAPGTGRR